MKTSYKSSTNRLVKYFKESRDKWKDRALKYQEDKRELQIKNRDIGRSKEKWKNGYLELYTQVDELKKKYQKIKELLQVIMED